MSPNGTMIQKANFKVLAHWLGFAGIIGLYFFVIRPIRVGFTSMLIEYVEPAIITEKGVELKQAATSVILSLSSQDAHTLKEFTYGLSFNSFFLVATLGLWALKDFKHPIQILILIHLLGWITATLFFMAGVYLHPNWWVGSDLITVYLIPMASLSWVAIVYAEQKRAPS